MFQPLECYFFSSFIIVIQFNKSNIGDKYELNKFSQSYFMSWGDIRIHRIEISFVWRNMDIGFS